jgi:hypothetical protein
VKSIGERLKFFMSHMKAAQKSYNEVFKFDERLGDFVVELDCFYQYDQIAAAYLRDCIPTENDEIAYKYMDAVYELTYNSDFTFINRKKIEDVDDLVEKMLKEIYDDEHELNKGEDNE